MNGKWEYTRRVLVVDDVEENRILLKYVLESLDIGVLEANDGQQAIDAARRELPDLVLMDLSMPVLDGFAATRQLKSSDVTRNIPVIAVSAFCGDPAKHQEALLAGCIDCVEKPIKIAKIKSIVDQFLTES